MASDLTALERAVLDAVEELVEALDAESVLRSDDNFDRRRAAEPAVVKTARAYHAARKGAATARGQGARHGH